MNVNDAGSEWNLSAKKLISPNKIFSIHSVGSIGNWELKHHTPFFNLRGDFVSI